MRVQGRVYWKSKKQQYTITIPAGTEIKLDPEVKYYGPLKLAQMFGAEVTDLK